MKQGQKILSCKKVKSNESGQALVEYVLLLVVVVSIIFGMKSVFQKLSDGMDNYMGKYIACLMEYGELPTLGIQDSSLKKHASGGGKSCDSQFAAFSFDEGRPPSSSSGSGSGSGSGQGSSGSSSSASSSKKNSGSGSGSGSGSSSNSNSNGDGSKNGGDDDSGDNETAKGIGKGGGSRSGRGSGKKGLQPGQSGNRTFGTMDGSGSDDQKTRIIDPDDDDAAAGKKGRKGARNICYVNYDQENYRALNGRMLQEIQKQEKQRSTPRAPAGTTKISKITDDSRLEPQVRAFIPPVTQKSKDYQQKEGSFGFGNIIRWLFIAGMVVAIVIFFGGQLLNYSNSDSN